MTIEFATEADIPAIMAIERTPGFEDVVGRWSQEQHAEQMAKASTRYSSSAMAATSRLSPSSRTSASPTAEFT